MAYETHFVKFGAQSKSKIMTPIYYHAKWKNPNLYTRALKHFAPSLAGFGFAAFSYFIFASEWRVICDKIPIYNTKFQDKPQP